MLQPLSNRCQSSYTLVNLLKIVFVLVSVILYLFILWKRLKDDYTPNLIFSTAFTTLVIALFFYLLAFKFIPSLAFWFMFGGFVFGISFNIFRYKYKSHEIADAFIIAVLPGLSLYYLVHAIEFFNWHYLVYFALNFALIILYIYLNISYKEFGWYKSGRVGFSGYVTLGCFFLVRGAIALIFPDMVSFSGKAEVVVSGILALVSFVSLYYLSKSGK